MSGRPVEARSSNTDEKDNRTVEVARNCQTPAFERRPEGLNMWLGKQRLSELGFLGHPLKGEAWLERVSLESSLRYIWI